MRKFSNIFFYFPHKDRGKKSGIGWVCSVFKWAFPEGEELHSPYDILKLGKRDILFVPRIFPLPFAGESYKNDILLSCILRDTKAVVVQTPFWDGEFVPEEVFACLGRVDILHAASKFLHTLFDGVARYGVVDVGVPVREWGKLRTSTTPAPTTPVVGGVIASPHPRKNPAAYFYVASMLPHFHFRIVFPIYPKYISDWCKVDIEDYPNVEVLYDLNEDELRDFYASLTYFLVLSGGEGYCIPAREAMKAGIPLIAPQNTVFMEFDGLKGVYLMPTEIVKISVDTTCEQIYRFPILQSVVSFLWNNPYHVGEVSEPPATPSLDEFRVNLLDGVERLLSSEPTVVVSREISSVWVTYPLGCGVGISVVTQQWAKRTGGLALPFYSVFSETFHPKTPVIIPYRPGLFDGHGDKSWGNEIFRLIATILSRPIRPPVAIWLHAAIPQYLVYLFRNWGVLLLTAHPDYAKSLGVPHLPLPIGDPAPAGGAQQNRNTHTLKNLPPNFFLSWGTNYMQLEMISRLISTFALHKIPVVVHIVSSRGLPDSIIQKVREITQHFANTLLSKFFTLLVSPPLSEDELEALLNQAGGYIIFDDAVVSLPYEVSAKIPHVLRKGKPIIVNAAPRCRVWEEYINLLPFTISTPRWALQARHYINNALSNLEDYIPRNVPTVEEETQRVMSIISSLLRRGS